ncbi:bifunctional [glutamate--ammonia ligase]-adenylyl-L-tyrosine phosphorylase/[glutamate--ammonia-ligase] adenylyltransferase [Alkanindiges illinoisensis]|uniref:bifunctional [glutamate--ammonia ligase]-adenylyl-L-tyrosine phosphorylase/[glutamate--ammonia-ligase] adenylyltransferase n=1 Tax=Alkanindiges illinoisensis TaxID=197183 RepID=UPI00068608AC|nr:bifunctional [glutamate--ammonia ligase]-adenylyl-L-tyrosine phosphorylase/[glutamate--ammonia-ligase] adenylyltransferase [Alkanindiges illinoisensis]
MADIQQADQSGIIGLVNSAQYERTLLASNYARQVMHQLPDAWMQDYAIDQFLPALTTEQINMLVQQMLDTCTEEILWMKKARQLRARLMLRWIWQDANDLTDVIQLTRELSDFADACIISAVKLAKQPLIARYGEPIGEENGQVQDLIVIGMGKLGAQELNLSSDIDLIFAFDEAGATNGRKSIDNQQFCIQWGQSVIRMLDQVTADGFVFRVDMRLRPWGDGSALAISHAALERYLAQHGREWERYAWIKARGITGGKAGQLLMDMTRPFVYRRYVDYTAIAAMRDMKAMIEREVQRRDSEDDIKLGAGGIREIEFIVQVFQLIYGGARRELRVKHCLMALQRLGEAGLIELADVNALQDSYLFLRRLEHAIQAIDDQQTQLLPIQPEIQARIAQILHFKDWPAFLEQLQQVRQVVSQQFAQLINDRSEKLENHNDSESLLALQQKIDPPTWQLVQNFWNSSAIKKLPENARLRLDAFWPALIRILLKKQKPQLALTRLIPLIESILRRSVYLVMLVENQGALQRLVDIVSVSPWIAEELTHYPVLLDEFLSTDFELSSHRDLEDSLRQLLLRVERDDIEEQMRVLRLFKKSQVLAVAASDVLAERPLMKVSDALTDIAEVVLQASLHLALDSVYARHGLPKRSNGESLTMDAPAFAIVGYGKLGGIELGYGSDLDLVFLHDVDEQSDTDGKKSISGMEFCVKVAQKLMSLLTTQTLDGRAYEVDTRLRPSGQAGVLVSSLNAFAHYQEKSAWLWEHQALVRARSIAGDALVRQRFEQIRHQILTRPRDEAMVRQEVKNMRQKMKDHLGSSSDQQKAGIFHLKQDAGGIVDIEFMAQYAVLAWSGTNPDLARFSDNVRILDDTATAGCLSRSDADALTAAYLRERTESHRLALAQQSMQVQAADWFETRKVVCTLWQRLIDPAAIAGMDN